MFTGLALYLVGLVALLTTFLPFSPMTIDLVNLRRENQLAIHRHRHSLWIIGGLCWAGTLLWAAIVLGHDVAAGRTLILLTFGSMATLAAMFWTGYVPIVMTPPDAPRRLAGSEAVLDADEIVLGVTIGTDSCAYRRDQIARPHYFKDALGGRDFIVSYCILCNSATAFSTRLDGRALDLRCVTAFNNNIIYLDHASGNYIQQLDGQVIAGPDTGRRLEMLPVSLMRWADWRALHPDTLLYDAPPRRLRDRLVALMLGVMIPIAKLARRDRPWHRIRGTLDPRLPAMAFVLGVELKGEACAYALSDLQRVGVVEDELGGVPIVVLDDVRRDAALVFARTLGDTVLEFQPVAPGDDGRVAADLQSGSFWDLAGRAIAGPRQGQQLTPIAHFNKLFWFSWALFKPHSRLYRQSTT